MRAPLAAALLLLTTAAVPPAAQAAGAPGWATPHTASAVPVGVYGAGPNGQGIQLFGTSGASQTRVAQIRAIKTDATQGTAVGIDADGRPGFTQPSVAVNPSGKLVAAWTMDTLSVGPIGLAAALGARTALPRTAAVLPTDDTSATEVATAIDASGTATVAWIEGGPPNLVKAATLRPGQAPQVAVLAATTTLASYVSLGLDSGGRPIVTWTEGTPTGTATTIGVARGDGTGAFAAAAVQPLTAAPLDREQTFVLADGTLLAFWSEGTQPGSVLTVRTATAPPGGLFGAPRTVATTNGSFPSIAAAANGRAAILYAVKSGSGVALRTVLRSTAGTWGSAHATGPSGRRVSHTNAGVDAKGRVVLLWDDGSASASFPTRILTARSSSSSNPPGDYHQLAQRSGDSRCNSPALTLSISGDGLGWWLCGSSGTSPPNRPRLARLTAPS